MAVMINWHVLLCSTGQRPSQSAEQQWVGVYESLQITESYLHQASIFLWSHGMYARLPI